MGKRVRIAQVAPLFESVPPQGYGGTERVVSYLTEELVRQGHQVTLFASGDSVTKARLCAPCSRSLRLDRSCVEPNAYHTLMLEQVVQEAASFDIIHFHTDYQHYPLSRRIDTPIVHTHHGRLDIPELAPVFQEFRDIPVVSISNAQRNPVSWLNWQGTVYHGLPKNLYAFNDQPEDYLLFLGRISVEKRVDQAIEIARRAGMPIRIAAKVDPRDAEYFHSVAKPLLKDPIVDFVGEVGGKDKDELLRNARALLFPIDWPEPFGLVMIEALACGTPVIAYRRGSVPEILDHALTGYVVDSIEQAVEAVRQIGAIDRRQCRRVFEQRFSNVRMTHDYLKVYQGLTMGRQSLAI